VGRLIPSGLPNQGHSIDFEYVDENTELKCFMVCECGWKIEIESFRHPWSIIETRVRLRRHMQELGLQGND
jgi:hypothetical protein